MMEKYQPRGKERGWYEDQGEEYLFIKAPAVSCGESERKREKNSVNRSDCDHESGLSLFVLTIQMIRGKFYRNVKKNQ